MLPGVKEATTVMFMPIGEKAHMLRRLIIVIQANLRTEHDIMCNFSIAWPATSPGLNISVFWLQDFLKDCILLIMCS